MKSKLSASGRHMLPYAAFGNSPDISCIYYGQINLDGISRSIPQKIVIAGIKFYRRNLSPMKQFKCPYIPTCSEYGLQAVEKYGALKGGLMALWRILRCNPFSHGGYDPVP